MKAGFVLPMALRRSKRLLGESSTVSSLEFFARQPKERDRAKGALVSGAKAELQLGSAGGEHEVSRLELPQEPEAYEADGKKQSGKKRKTVRRSIVGKIFTTEETHAGQVNKNERGTNNSSLRGR